MGLFQRYNNEFGQAEQSYQEALQISRKLADFNPETYLKGIMQMQKNKTIKNIMAYTLGGSLYHNVKDTTTNLFYIYLYNDTFLPSITRSNIINKWFLSKNRLYPIDRNTNEINKTEDYYLKQNFIFHK